MLCFLYRYGIELSDVFRGINDTTNSALLTGKLLSEGRVPEKGARHTCYMHTQELVVNHAFGLKERNKNNAVSDSFKPGKNITKKVRDLCATIMNRKMKGLFRELNDLCIAEFGCKALMLELPNDTRVSGTFKMFVSCLRSKELIKLFCKKCKNPEKFTHLQMMQTEWIFLTEIEAVMRYCNVLAMESQTETAGYNCFAYYCVCYCRKQLTTFKSLEIMDVRMSWAPNTRVEDIPKISADRDTLSIDTLEFVNRLIKEYTTYFPYPDSDMVLMMAVHPIMQWNGYT